MTHGTKTTITSEPQDFKDETDSSAYASSSSTTTHLSISVLLVPRRTLAFDMALESAGVSRDVTCHALPLLMLLLEPNMLSLELPDAFADATLHGSTTPMYYTAQALDALCRRFGQPERVVAVGGAAVTTCRIWEKGLADRDAMEEDDYDSGYHPRRTDLHRADADDHSTTSTSTIRTGTNTTTSDDHTFSSSGNQGRDRHQNRQGSWSSRGRIAQVLLVDRAADLVTPLLTQMTYEGLIDEVLGIENRTVRIPPAPGTPVVQNPPGAGPSASPSKNDASTSTSTSTPSPSLPTKTLLTASSDAVFREIRDKSYAAAARWLRDAATAMQQDYRSLDRHQHNVQDMRAFVRRLHVLPEVARHTSLAEHLSKAARTETFVARIRAEQGLLEGHQGGTTGVGDGGGPLRDVLRLVEELIVDEAPLEIVLRLLGLVSHTATTAGGVPTKTWDALCLAVLHSYGHEHALTLANLRRAGVIWTKPALGSATGSSAGSPGNQSGPFGPGSSQSDVAKVGAETQEARNGTSMTANMMLMMNLNLNLGAGASAAVSHAAGAAGAAVVAAATAWTGGGPRPPYVLLQRLLRQLVADVDELQPGDAAYAYGGYAPLSVRLAEWMGGPGVKNLQPSSNTTTSMSTTTSARKERKERKEKKVTGDRWGRIPLEALRTAVGLVTETVAARTDGGKEGARGKPRGRTGKSGRSECGRDQGREQDRALDVDEESDPEGPEEVLLVVLVGGACRAELSALRWLDRYGQLGYRIAVLTTHITSGTALVRGLIPVAVQRLDERRGEMMRER